MKGRAASTSQLGPFETEVLATEENFAGLTEAAVPRDLFRKILSLIDDLQPRPAPVWAGEIDGQVKTTGGQEGCV